MAKVSKMLAFRIQAEAQVSLFADSTQICIVFPALGGRRSYSRVRQQRPVWTSKFIVLRLLINRRTRIHALTVNLVSR